MVNDCVLYYFSLKRRIVTAQNSHMGCDKAVRRENMRYIALVLLAVFLYGCGPASSSAVVPASSITSTLSIEELNQGIYIYGEASRMAQGFLDEERNKLTEIDKNIGEYTELKKLALKDGNKKEADHWQQHFLDQYQVLRYNTAPEVKGWEEKLARANYLKKSYEEALQKAQ